MRDLMGCLSRTLLPLRTIGKLMPGAPKDRRVIALALGGLLLVIAAQQGRSRLVRLAVPDDRMRPGIGGRAAGRQAVECDRCGTW
jgi:hypothetical protein